VFQGHYVNLINDKGRLSIPSEFREVLSGCEAEYLWVTKDLDKCLAAYAPDEWEQVKKKASKLSDIRKADIIYKRHILNAAQKCQLDAQGRILIPVGLREYAGLKKKCYIMGVSNRFEIWDAETYDMYMKEAMKDPDDLRKQLADLGF
jgi:MraZ protein